MLGVVALSGNPFCRKYKAFQFSTNVYVVKDLSHGPCLHITTIQWKSDGGKLNPGPSNRSGCSTTDRTYRAKKCDNKVDDDPGSSHKF